MRSRTALVIAVVFIFGAAMAAEFAGLVPREVQTAPDEAGADGDASADAPATASTDPEVDAPAWRDVRIGVIGGFVVACIFVLMRATGEMW